MAASGPGSEWDPAADSEVGSYRPNPGGWLSDASEYAPITLVRGLACVVAPMNFCGLGLERVGTVIEKLSQQHTAEFNSIVYVQ